MTRHFRQVLSLARQRLRLALPPSAPPVRVRVELAWGETDAVATVVDEFVNAHAGEQRRRALFGADEVNGDQQQQPAENGPGQKFADRNRPDVGCCDGDAGHVRLPGMLRPVAVAYTGKI